MARLGANDTPQGGYIDHMFRRRKSDTDALLSLDGPHVWSQTYHVVRIGRARTSHQGVLSHLSISSRDVMPVSLKATHMADEWTDLCVATAASPDRA